MEYVEKSIEVDVPVRTAYNQWTQFESFPQFMDGVEEVRQIDDKNLFWRAKVMGVEKGWNAEIVEQVPDKRIAWHSTSGTDNAGIVTFDTLSPTSTKLTLRLGYEPEGAMENLGKALGSLERAIEGDLKRFKKFIEGRRVETGAWREEIH